MGAWVDRRPLRPVILIGAILLVALAFATLSSDASATTSGTFTIGVSRPALIRNAIIAVRVSCPRSQSRCTGATAAYSLPDPTQPIPALQRGLVIAPSAPFSLARGKSTTLRLLIPLSEVGVLRQARRFNVTIYTLAGNPRTRATQTVFTSAVITLATHDRRLYGLHRLRLRLLGFRLNKSTLSTTVRCNGTSAKAMASNSGACDGVIAVFGGMSGASPTRLVSLGGGGFFLFRNTSTGASIRLLKGRLATLRRQPNPYLVVYAIASDRVDQLSAAQLLNIPIK
jgi:hypothetical protein